MSKYNPSRPFRTKPCDWCGRKRPGRRMFRNSDYIDGTGEGYEGHLRWKHMNYICFHCFREEFEDKGIKPHNESLKDGVNWYEYPDE